MKVTLLAAAIAAVVISAGSAMARGPELSQRVGAFPKGGTGVEVRSERAAVPTYRLVEHAPDAAPVAQPEHSAIAQANQERPAAVFKVDHNHH